LEVPNPSPLSQISRRLYPSMTETDPSFGAFCPNEPSERFIFFASFATGVLAFECIFNSLISDAVYSLRMVFFFAPFLATSISNLIRSGLIRRSHSSSSELKRTDDHEHLLILSLDYEPFRPPRDGSW
jgi:hypothetical protein